MIPICTVQCLCSVFVELIIHVVLSRAVYLGFSDSSFIGIQLLYLNLSVHYVVSWISDLIFWEQITWDIINPSRLLLTFVV